MSIFSEQIGLIDCISNPGQTALERALELAKEMSSCGEFLHFLQSAKFGFIMALAPLALRAAKRAISKAPELDLESGIQI